MHIQGKKFGRLIPIAYLGKSKWRCQCDCGNMCEVDAYNISHGRTKSCGCIAKENAHNLNLKAPGESAANQIYLGIKKNAEHRGYMFNLTKEEILERVFQPCHYCGRKPSNEKKNWYNNGALKYNGLDRVNNNHGYTKDNIVPCCWTCNEKKKSMTKDEFLYWIKQVYEYSVAKK